MMHPLRRPARWLAILTAAALPLACASPPTALRPGQPAVLIDQDGVALGGFDPVSYFVEGEARPGDPNLSAKHEGATYHFSSEGNREAFTSDPASFEPAYGGWCAWALADGAGSLVKVDPESYLIQHGRLLLFFDGFLADTRAFWLDQSTDELEAAADRNWDRVLSSREE